MARPSKLTPETQKRIMDALKIGATYEDAAWHGGIAYNTFNEWMKKGEAAKAGEFREFYDQAQAAVATGNVGLLTIIEKSARAGDWRAAAWKLDHRKGYRPRTEVRHGGDPDNPTPIATHGTFTIEIDRRRSGDDDTDDDRDTGDLDLS